METKQAESPDLAEWRVILNGLYQKLRGWLSDGMTWPTGQDLPPTVGPSESIALDEEHVGSYQVPQLLLRKIGRYMWVRPVARSVLGADGRVDLTGAGRSYVLLYIKNEGNEGGEWYWLNDRRSGVKYDLEPLTSRLFHDLVEACLQ